MADIFFQESTTFYDTLRTFLKYFMLFGHFGRFYGRSTRRWNYKKVWTSFKIPKYTKKFFDMFFKVYSMVAPVTNAIRYFKIFQSNRWLIPFKTLVANVFGAIIIS